MKPYGLKASWQKVTNTYAYEAARKSRQKLKKQAIEQDLKDSDLTEGYHKW